MDKVKFYDLIKDIRYEYFVDHGDREIDNISFDTRTVNENSVFVCIKGINTDRHTLVDEAYNKGCKVFVSEYPLKLQGITNLVVEDTNEALALISANYFGNPQKKLKIIGVTGTNGKTTSTTLIKAVLESAGFKTGLVGTNFIEIGDKKEPSSGTTPEAPELFRYFKMMAQENCTHAVMEVSSHALSLKRVFGIEFEAGLFTNLTQDHLDYHKTMEGYALAKSEFFLNCKNSVINKDSKYYDVMIKNAKDKLYTYSIDENSDYKAEHILHTDSGVEYSVKGSKVKFPVLGNFSVYNSLGVYAVCDILGIERTKIESGLENAPQVKGRCEIVPVKMPFRVVIDYAHTPDGVLNIINAMNEIKKKRLITVFGCGGDRDKGKRPQMGEIASKYSDITVVTSDNPRSEKPDSIIDDIMAGIDKGEVYREVDRRKAIAMAIDLAKEDDIVLLLGKGHETVQKFKDFEIEFDERKIVREICDLM